MLQPAQSDTLVNFIVREFTGNLSTGRENSAIREIEEVKAPLLDERKEKRLDLEFTEMAEISLDDPPTPAPGHPPLPASPPIKGISVWIEKFSIMAAVLTSRCPEKAPNFLPTRPQ